MKKTLFCIVGETCSGKDTMVSRLIKEYPDLLKAVCSYASRPKRENEEEGREHYFVSEEEFATIKKELEEKDELVAYTKIVSSSNPDGYEYMASLDAVKDSNLYIIDPKGIKFLKEHFADRIENIVVIYITATLPDRIWRARFRSDFNTEFRNRVINEFEQFLDFNLNIEYYL